MASAARSHECRGWQSTRPPTNRSRSAAMRAVSVGRSTSVAASASAKRHDARHVVGAAAPVALLAATDDERVDADAVAQRQHADALRSAELVAAERHRVDVRPQLTQVEPAGGLDGVGVQHGARRAVADEARDRRQIGDRADLVVDGHHADDGDVRSERRVELVEIDVRSGVDADDGAVVALDDLQHRVVLGGRAHGPATADRADDRRVVALGAAAGEHDLAWAAPDDVGDAVPCLVDGPPGVPGEAMRPARVGEALGEERQHRLDRVRPHRRRRRMIEVDEPGHGATR